MIQSMKESLHNRVEVRHIRGKNRVTDMVYASPFRIFQLEETRKGGPVPLMFSNYGGGMLQGDKIHLNIHCGQNSSLVLLSQANSQVFKNENLSNACFKVHGQLEKGSHVSLRPEPVVLHKGARYEQYQRWDLEGGSSLLLVDWMQSGRSDSGECFQFHSYHSELEIYRHGKKLLKERFRCLPDRDNPYSTAGFMGLDHMVNIYMVGYEQIPDTLYSLQNKEIMRVNPLTQQSKRKELPLYLSITELPEKSGFMIRALAKSRLDLENLLLRHFPQ